MRPLMKDFKTCRRLFCDMKTKKLKKAIIITTLSFGIYCLSKVTLIIFTNPLLHDLEIRNATISKAEVLATHFALPLNFRGKKLPFHRVYETRQVGYSSDLQNGSLVSNKTKIILLWTPWNGIQRTINYYSLLLGNRSFVKYNCPNQNCVTTRNKSDIKAADAVLFHLLDTNSADLPSYRSTHQLWILYNMEPPWQIKKRIYPELPHLKNIFNWTMSYRYDSNIVAKYGFVMRSSENTSYVSFHRKTKNIVWFVSDCSTESKREDYVHELSKYIDVDIYGKCGDHKCYPAQSATCYERVVENYKFYLSFENALCKDYVTEKFFNIFNYDIVPIVFGAANYSQVAPDGTFIDATKFSEPKRLAEVLLEISRDKDLYGSFLLKKRAYTAYLDPWPCRLCERLHSNNQSKILEGVEEWWLDAAHCKSWNGIDRSFQNSK